MVDTALILDAVNTWLTESLHQTYEESSVKDGMDVSLISINKVSNEVYFSGAYHSIYLVRNDVLVEYKGDKFPVGVFIEDELNQFRGFKVDVQPGDMIYLFTDGFADQFGGPKGKKYKYAQLRDKLVAIGSKDMEEQRSQLMNNFDLWKGNLEQVDDVLILGIRF
jgi:serine phosphatase RsbU (regulator of sigma subunit)